MLNTWCNFPSRTVIKIKENIQFFSITFLLMPELVVRINNKSLEDGFNFIFYQMPESAYFLFLGGSEMVNSPP